MAKMGPARELVFVKVFEQYTSGVAVRQLRFEAYRHTTSGAECAIIEDLKHLRMTLGPDAQHFLATRAPISQHRRKWRTQTFHRALWSYAALERVT